jgi:hypothetical protein
MLMWVVLAAGCNKQPDGYQLVSWYLDHDTERQSKIAWCADDAERGVSIDCQNAEEAQRRKQVGSQSTLKPIDWGAKPTP